jgi:glycerol-3-phosphate dehydrogenase
MLIPKTEDGRVLFAVQWKGRLLVGTTEQEVTIHDELYVTKEEIAYLLRHLNRYLAAPVKPDQVVSGIAGARPLVSSGDLRDTKKLARDHELEVDSQSGLISIMGGKWTTYRAMAEDAANAVQRHLGVLVTESPTKNHPLIGSEGFTLDYWKRLASNYGIPEPTARYLAGKFGTAATEVLDLAQEDPALAAPIVPDFPAVRAQVIYSARAEMAMTIEDVLFRRLGLQLYSWHSAIHAAPIVASLLGRELGWSPDQSRSAAREYEAKINRLLMLAGLEPERDSTGAGGSL